MPASLSFSSSNNWAGGFSGAFVLTAGDTALDGWTIGFDADFTIDKAWTFEVVSHVGSHYVVRNLAWNARLAAGARMELAFQGGGSPVAPTGLLLNGADPDPPTLSIADAALAEGAAGYAGLAFTVTLSRPAAAAVTVDYGTADGTATAGSDYQALAGSLTFAPGETSRTITVATRGDTGVEADETFLLRLSAPTGATIADGVATGTILNDDLPPLQLSVGDAVVAEGQAGTRPLNFVVQLSRAATVPVTLRYATADATAMAGTDYAAAAGTLTFAPGETRKTVSILVTGDRLAEGDEWMSLRLGGATGGATILDGVGRGMISDDDRPALTVGNVTVKEGNAGTADMVFTIRLSQAATAPVTVHYATADGTALAGTDYLARAGTLSFAVGEISKTVAVPVIGDRVAEKDESFSLVLTAPTGAAIADGSGLGTIRNNDLPALTVGNVTVKEGNAGIADMVFTVRLSQAATAPVTVQYATADGTALAGADYLARAGTLSFAAGEISKTVAVPVIGDRVAERDESFSLLLTAPTGAVIADGSGLGTIRNNDLPALTIGNATVKEGNAGTADMVFTVRLSQAATAPITVHYATADGTALAGADYLSRSGTLSFAAGEISKTVAVPVIGDRLAEQDETLSLVLTAPTGAVIADGSGLGTIRNNDLPSLRVNDVVVTEASGSIAPGYFSTRGNQIVDADGTPVRIAGVNWFGLETATHAPHGLDQRGYKDMLDQMVALGFNTLRLPFSTDLLHDGATPSGINLALNPDLRGLTGLQIIDRIVAHAGEIGLRVILDHHRSAAGNSASENGLWYDAAHSEAQWIADWQMLATRYAGNPTVIGADLHNEPYAGTWGDGKATDWAAAAERAGDAIGTVNHDWLIFVEGIGTYRGNAYWWGGNLMGVRDRPVSLDQPDKLVYSAHDYPNSVYAQSWFSDPAFPANLPAKFEQMWGFIHEENIAPVWIGEFGSKLTDPKDVAWLDQMIAYLGGQGSGDQGISWAWWSWNADSGDTGGILKSDWKTVEAAKLAALEPLQFDFQAETTTLARFTVSLSQPAAGAVLVDFHTSPGTASQQDFTALAGTLAFAPGEQTKTVAVAVTHDALTEADERFALVLSNPRGATLADDTGLATIHDDPSALHLLG